MAYYFNTLSRDGSPKIMGAYPPKDMKLAKKGKLSDYVGHGLHRTKYKRRKSSSKK